jgi:hypothetical protein
MATVKISQLPPVSGALGSTDVVAAVKSGTTVKATVASLGYQPAGTNAVATTIQTKLRETISVADFGAVGDGVTNDAVAIQNAIDYAFSLGASIYFPAKNYYVNTGIILKCGCTSQPGAAIQTANNIVTVTIPTGNYVGTHFTLPQIVGGSIGLLLDGTNLATIFVPNIALSTNGLVLQINNTNKSCADNVVTFHTINGNAEAAIKFNYLATSISGTLFQGNQIKGNFITSSKYGVYFYDVNNGSLGQNLTWDDTQVDVFAIDPNNLTGSIGFYANSTFPAGRCILSAKGFFDSMNEAYIKGSALNTIFEISNSGQWNYTKFKITGACQIVNFSSRQGNFWGINPIFSMTTTFNTLSSFNGGIPLMANRNLLSFTLTSPLAAGDKASFYFYHMLMTQYSPKITAESFWNEAMYVNSCNECSTPGAPVPGAGNPYPFQGIFVVRATAAVPAGTYYTAITVNDTPQ